MKRTHVLLATLGTTPEILTEAIYWFVTERGIIFSEVHAITTVAGKNRLDNLVFGNTGALGKLLKHLKVPAGTLAFHAGFVHVLYGVDGQLMDDIRTREDSEAAADQILEVAERLCGDPSVIVHATLAGGRKTMGAYLHSSLQLVSRADDELFHILVHPKLEQAITTGTVTGYFSPTTTLTIEGVKIEPRAQLTCVSIPILHWPARKRGATAMTDVRYRELVEQRQTELERMAASPVLLIDCKSRTVIVGGVRLKLSANEVYWYGVVASLAANRFGPLEVTELAEVVTIGAFGATFKVDRDAAPRLKSQLAELQQIHERVFPREAESWRRKMKTALTGKDTSLATTFSRIKTQMERMLGEAASPYIVKSKRNSGTYELQLPPEAITIR